MVGEIGDCAHFCACGLRSEVFPLLLCSQFQITLSNDFVPIKKHSFRDRNLFGDDKLAKLVHQAGDIVNGLSTDELRQDANLREYIAGEMNHLRISVDGALEDLPRRKIRLAA
jgi:hypothetical protein